MMRRGEVGTAVLFGLLVLGIFSSALFLGPEITGAAVTNTAPGEYHISGGAGDCGVNLINSSNTYYLDSDISCPLGDTRAIFIRNSSITLDCQGNTISGATFGVQIGEFDDVSEHDSATVKNCNFVNSNFSAIRVESKYNQILNNTFNDQAGVYHIWVDGESNGNHGSLDAYNNSFTGSSILNSIVFDIHTTSASRIYNNYFEIGSGILDSNAIRLFDSSNIDIYNNVVDETNRAVYLRTHESNNLSASNIRIFNNNFSVLADGIYILRNISSDIEIYGNRINHVDTVTEVGDFGILVDGGTDFVVNDVLIRDNAITGDFENSIRIDNSSNVEIRNNNFSSWYNSNGFAFKTAKTNLDLFIHSNFINANTNLDVTTFGGDSDLTFYNNTISGGSISDIYLTSTGNIDFCTNDGGNNYFGTTLGTLAKSYECDVSSPIANSAYPGSPGFGDFITSTDVDFTINITDVANNLTVSQGISQCTLYVWNSTGLDRTVTNTTTITENQNYTFPTQSLIEGATYSWNVECTDDYIFPNTGFLFGANYTFTIDSNPPEAPTLYLQETLKGSKSTNDSTTSVVGYFENDPMVDVTVVVLNQSGDYTFNATQAVANQTSNNILETEVVKFSAPVNETIIFLNWSASVESALSGLRYLEFTNHEKTFFTRYNVTQVDRVGNELRVEIDPGLEEAVTPSTQTNIFDAPLPNGYFRVDNVDLYVGNNSIAAWGTDNAGNSGFAAEDWIVRTVVPQSTTLPNAPVLESINSTYFNVTNITIYGHVQDTSSDLEVHLFAQNTQGDRKTTVLNTTDFNATSTPQTNTTVTIATVAGTSLVRFTEADEVAGLNNATYAEDYIQFENHEREHFLRYQIASIVNPIGEDPYFTLSQNLSQDVSVGEKITIYNEQKPTRWFNTTLDVWAGVNTVYGISVNSQGENASPNQTTTVSFPTGNLDVDTVNDFGDITTSKNIFFNWTDVSLTNPGFSYYEYTFEELANTPSPSRETVIDWTSTTNNSVNISIVDANAQYVYYLKVRAYDTLGNVGNESSSDGILFLDPTVPVLISIDDGGAWQQSKTTLNATWEFEDNESDIIQYEYSIGTDQYPNASFEDVISRTIVNGSQNYANVPITNNLTEGERYYFNVRAKNGNANYNGSWSEWAFSDGIIVDSQAFTGASITYFNGTYNLPTVDVQYNLGSDPVFAGSVAEYPSGFKNASIYKATANITFDQGGLNCGVYDDYNTFVSYTSNVSSTISSVPLDNGKCTKFSLIVEDNAGNTQEFFSADTQARIVNDQTPPSLTGVVSDDGFSTIYGEGLDASWTPATEDVAQTSIFYTVKVWEDSILSNSLNCFNNGFGNADCSLVSEAVTNTTASTVNLPFELTHGSKYYFEVIAWNYFNLNSTSIFSDGIVYYDVFKPNRVEMGSVENDTNHSDLTYIVDVNQNGENITIIATTEEGTNSCSLFNIDVDYLESSPFGIPCSVNPTQNSGDLKYNVTCSENFTIQGYYSRHIGCTDSVGNAQDYTENFDFFIDYDYPEQPTVSNVTIYKLQDSEVSTQNILETLSVTSELSGITTLYNITFSNFSQINQTADITINTTTLQDIEIGTLVEVDGLIVTTGFVGPTTIDWKYTKTELFLEDLDGGLACEANVIDADLDENQNITSVEFDIYFDGILVNNSVQFTGKTSKNIYRYNISDPGNLHRGSTITCVVNATDNYGFSSVQNGTNVLLNSPPSSPTLISPTSNVTAGVNTAFSWVDSTDADFDVAYYTIEVDENNLFNFANLKNRSLVDSEVFVSNAAGSRLDVAIDEDAVVWFDSRSGTTQIFTKDLVLGNEQFLVTPGSTPSSLDLEGDYVVFEDSVGVRLYKISTGSLTTISASGSNPSINDGVLAYVDSGSIKEYDIAQDTTSTLLTGVGTVSDLVIEGILAIYSNTVNTTVFDRISNSSYTLSTPNAQIATFGDKVVLTDSSTTRIHTLSDQSSITAGYVSEESLILGDYVISNDAAADFILNLFNDNTQGITNQTSFAIEGSTVVYSNTTHLVKAELDATLPATFGSYNNLEELSITAQDGDYYWRVKVCDQAGALNSCQYSNYGSFVLDTTEPNLTIDAPLAGNTISNGFTLQATSTDELSNSLTLDYTIIHANNGTLYDSGVFVGFEPSFSKVVDFSSLGTSAIFNMTLYVNSSDPSNNINATSVNFTVNNNLPSFNFSLETDEIVTTDVTGDSFAYNVKNSQLRVVGPFPATTQKYIRSFTTPTLETHNYSDSLLIGTWDDGTYTMVFTGSNDEGSNAENRTFVIDRQLPVINYISPANNSVHLTNETLAISVNVSDANIKSIDITYPINTTNTTTKLDNTSTSLTTAVTTDNLNLYNLINTTVYFTVNATDKADQSVVTTYQFDVQSSAPRYAGVVANLNEDEQNPITFDANVAFEDDDILNNATDSLTFSVLLVPSTVTIDINNTTGIVTITDIVEVNVSENITLISTDLYGKTTNGTFEITFEASNDIPTASTIPDLNVTEDINNLSIIDLDTYFTDGDHELAYTIFGTSSTYDNVTNTTSFELTHMNITINQTDGTLSVYPKQDADQYSELVIVATEIGGSESGSSNQFTIDILPVNDAPIVESASLMPTYVSTQNISLNSIISDVDGTTENTTVNYTVNGIDFVLTNNTILNTFSNGDIINATIYPMDDQGLLGSSFTTNTVVIDQVDPLLLTSFPTGFTTNTTQINFTTENASCEIYLNGVLVNETEFQTYHSYFATGLSDGTQQLTTYCVDLAGNDETLAFNFTVFSGGIDVTDVTSNITTVLSGESVDVNITTATIDAIEIEVNVTSPIGLAQTFNTTLPAIDEVNYYGSIIVTNTTEPGDYDISIFANITGYNDTFTKNSLFTVYPAVNQTVTTS